MTRKGWFVGGLFCLATATSACSPPWDDGEGERDDGIEGPGSKPWTQDENIACKSDADCAQGEACENEICQIKRCWESYSSVPPLGHHRFFGTDGEIAVVSDKSFVDGFEAKDGKYMNSWDLGGFTVVDVAGGNLNGARPHGIAVALEASSKVRLNQSTGVTTLDVGVVPVALAAGDVDGDNHDELVAFSKEGKIALCDVEKSSCKQAAIDGANGKDVAVADVDGDGFAEAVFLFDLKGKSGIVVWNLDADKTGQEKSIGWELNIAPRAMAAGDVTGDRVAEVLLLEDGGWWGWVSDKLHVFSPAKEAFLGSHGVNGKSRDVAVGDRDSDDRAEIVILREDKKLELFTADESGKIESQLVADVTVGEAPTRLALLDWDGDSAAARLVAGPELVSGNVVPTQLLTFPPYPHTIAQGTSSLMVGNGETTSETHSDTVSLSLGMMVGFGVETPIFEAKISASVEYEVSVTKSLSRSLFVGQNFWLDADPDKLGFDYGAVVLACGCYQRYRYVAEDPAGIIAADGHIVDLFVPVGGQTVLWSTKRYNALARARGDLPIIEVPYRIGDLKSYPATPMTTDGQPIPAKDNLFPDVPVYQASDVGATGFWLSAGETETNEVAESIQLGVSGSLGAGGLEVELSAGVGFSKGYAISVGKEAMFNGSVPPLPDDTSTPEDEFELYRYSFVPQVYRHRYTDAAGEEAGYYVLTYAVSK
jgi:hypothetical protein